MIYQLYYKDDQGILPFGNQYIKFDLANITENRYLPAIQSEYCGMLYHYYNPDKYDWIGFTSCRQLKKGYKGILKYDIKDITYQVQKYDILTWGYLCCGDTKFCYKKDISDLFNQTEFFHKGLMRLMNIALTQFNHRNLIELFKNTSCGIFSNYWLMSKENFNQFIEWSKPIVSWMVSNPKLYNTSTGHYNTVGWIIERMFIYWYLTNNKTIKVINA